MDAPALAPPLLNDFSKLVRGPLAEGGAREATSESNQIAFLRHTIDQRRTRDKQSLSGEAVF